MSAPELLEGDVFLILNHLKANLPGALADVRTDRADAKVTTEPPQAGSYFIYPKAVGYRTPAVFVIGDSTEFRQDDGPNFVKAHSSVNVTVLVEDRDPERLTIKAFRYASALHQLLEQQTLEDAKLKIVCKVKRLENSPLYSDSDDESAAENVFRKEVALSLEVDHWENF